MYLAVYGTLRKCVNPLIYNEGAEYIETTKLNEFKLYRYRSTPIAVPTGDPKDSIVIEIYKVNEDLFDDVDYFEKTYGYYLRYIENFHNKYNTLGIYVKFNIELYEEIKSGDYCKWYRRHL